MRLHGTALLALTAILGLGARPLKAQSDSVPRAVLEGLSVLERPMTVAAWRQGHQADSVTAFAPALYGEPHEWCAEAVSYRLVSNRIVIRRAYFYVPPLTPASVLPARDAPAVISRNCILGTVTVEVPVSDTSIAPLTGRVTDTLIAKWGSGGAPRNPFYHYLQGSVRLVALRGEWHRDSLVFLVGRQSAVRTLSPRVVAVGFAPVSHLFEYHMDLGGEDQGHAEAALARAVSLAGRDADYAHLKEAKARYDSSRSQAIDPKATVPEQIAAARVDALHLVDAVDLWVRQGRGLDSLRRAASFFLLDQIMKDEHWFEDSVERGRLETLGATFDEDHYEGWVYTGSFLDSADRLNPRGPAHALVVMKQFHGECSPTAAIHRAQQLLESVRDSAVRFQLYKILGDAWADSVGMPGGPDADPATPIAASPGARENAIQSYREALALNRTSPSAVQAWWSAWRLVAGERPFWKHFYCDND
ncbi:MAG TPA: hypothetical protein VJN62_11480 [Gemmatimonadales bacterium]|nr:hypothetical protein [Gemmatimonadales bacterium]